MQWHHRELIQLISVGRSRFTAGLGLRGLAREVVSARRGSLLEKTVSARGFIWALQASYLTPLLFCFLYLVLDSLLWCGLWNAHIPTV